MAQSTTDNSLVLENAIIITSLCEAYLDNPMCLGVHMAR